MTMILDDSQEALLPLPQVQYEWDEFLAPVGRYSCSTRARCSKLDELKLNLVFDVNSSLLPTKMHLEIRDKTGRVVFR